MKIQTWRLSAVLVLLAASLLLAAPGVAGAHVKAKYRTEYKSRLTSLNQLFLSFASNYDNMKQGSIDEAATLAPMVGDPDQHDQLVAGEKWCLQIYTVNKGKPQAWAAANSKTVDGFRARAKRYFATATQQRKFTRDCNRLKAFGNVLIMLANDHVYESYRQLGFDPPHLDLSATAVADADEDAATGHEGFDKWLAALRALL